MTTDRDLDRLLDSWFLDTAMPVPDRAFDAAVERVYRQQQRPAWRFLSWRFPTMSSSLKLLLAAGVLLAVILGGSILMSGGGPGPVPSPTPTPTATPSPTPRSTPSPAATFDPETVGMEVQGESMTWRAVVPEGWSNSGAWFMAPSQGTTAPTGISVTASGAVNVPLDPCDGVGKESTGATVADVIAMLEARDDLVLSNQTEATLGGYSGTRVDVELPADLSACADLYFLFAEPDGSGIYAQGPSNRFQVWILDVDGQTIVVWIESFPETPAADLADAQRIVDSIVITP